VGSFLSSGLDSSIISTIAVKKLKKLDTFTVGFENIDDPYHGKSDESVYASEYAKKIGSNHHTILVTGKKYLDDLDDFVKFGDQPWGVSSGLGVVAMIPLFFTKFTSLGSTDLLISGSGLIIIVGVVMELIRQINAQMLEHDYEKLV
jgi:asparagine synthetase B (glutamine-hydrolysing)